MSCGKGRARFAGLAGVKAGITTASNKAGGVVGVLATETNRAVDQIDRLGTAASKSATPYTRLLAGTPKSSAPGEDSNRRAGWAAVRRAGTVAAVAIGAASGRVATGALARVSAPARALLAAVKLSDKISSDLGNAAGKLSADGSAGQVEQETRRFFFFKGKRQVPFWTSKLTPLLNRPDAVVGLRKREIVSSSGVMFQAGGKTWHQGNTVVKVDGRERNVTHLQSLSLPARHVFFDRPLSKTQAVDIATGKTRAGQVPGFKGQVSPAESITLIWAGTKQGLIRAQIYWPVRQAQGRPVRQAFPQAQEGSQDKPPEEKT